MKLHFSHGPSVAIELDDGDARGHYNYGIVKLSDGRALDGESYAKLARDLGAWIECDTIDEKMKIEGSLITGAFGLSDTVKVR